MSNLFPNFLTEQDAILEVSRRLHAEYFKSSIELDDCPMTKIFAHGVSIDNANFILEIEFKIGHNRRQLGQDGVDLVITHRLIPYDYACSFTPQSR